MSDFQSATTDIVPINIEAPGKPARRVRRREAIERAEMYAARNLPKYLRKLQELAEGILVMKTDSKTGEPSVYLKPPDREALQYLVDRAMGKTPQRIEMTGDEGGPMEVVSWVPAIISEEDTRIIEAEVVERGKE